MKYKIAKKEYKNKGGEIYKTTFEIKRKFLFIWLPVWIRSAYVLSHLGGAMSDFMLQYKRYVFSDIKQANKYLEEYVYNSFSEKYKGCVIKKVEHERSGNPIYINSSVVTEYYASNPCYKGYSGILQAREAIDKLPI